MPDLAVQRMLRAWRDGRAEREARAAAAQRRAAHLYTLAEARADSAAAGVGIPTGFPSLDAQGIRIAPATLVAVLARPGGGKTTFLTNAVVRHCEQGEGWAALVSYEEPLHELYARLVRREYAIAQPVPSVPHPDDMASWLRTGTFASAVGGRTDGRGAGRDWLDGLNVAAARVDALTSDRLLLINGDTHGGEIDAVVGLVQNIARVRGSAPSLIAIDYLQKIRPPAALMSQTRQHQLQVVSDHLRVLAKTMHTCVLIGAQVNRGAVDEQPALHHLREGDDIGNDASVVLSLMVGQPSADPLVPPAPVVRVHTAKHRTGRAGATNVLHFRGDCNLIGGALSPEEANAMLPLRLPSRELARRTLTGAERAWGGML